MICSVSFGLHTLNPLNRLADADGAKTLANWLEEWVEDDLENDGPEFADTAHFDFVTSFERWIKPDMCTRHKCEYETPEGGQWHTEDQRKDLVHDILEESVYFITQMPDIFGRVVSLWLGDNFFEVDPDICVQPLWVSIFAGFEVLDTFIEAWGFGFYHFFSIVPYWSPIRRPSRVRVLSFL